jgi:hypothetical protein
MRQAIFTELFSDEIADGLVQGVHQAYAPEVRELVSAAAACRTLTSSPCSEASRRQHQARRWNGRS